MSSKEIREQIGHRIRVRRVERKLKQQQLGELVGVPQPLISDWECGRRPLHLEDAITLAKALQTTVGYLAGESPRV